MFTLKATIHFLRNNSYKFRLKYIVIIWRIMEISNKMLYNTHTGEARSGAVGLGYKPKGRGFDSRWCLWNFSWT